MAPSETVATPGDQDEETEPAPPSSPPPPPASSDRRCGGRCGAVAGAAWQRAAAPVAGAAAALALWGATVAAVGAAALPGGQLFELAALAAAAAVAGAGARRVGLPRLVGPLAAGAALRSLGAVHLQGDYQHAAAVIRKGALAVILIRAGLGLDAGALRRLSGLVLRLAAVPSAVEAAALAAAAHMLLGLPWMWGAMAGSMMAAVSPAVVIPALFRLEAQGYGTDKGIPTLVVAAASLDDVVAVTAFGVLHGVVFAEGNSAWEGVVRGLMAVPMGVAFGAAWGALARFVPRKSDAHAAPLRSLLVAGGGLLAVLGSDAIGFDGAGPLGAILAAFVAAHAWRRQGWDNHNPVSDHFRAVWTVFQTLLFALIGAEVDLTALEPLNVALGAGALALALGARIAITVLIAFGGGMTLREKIFLSFAWFPKATVQAALGPAALDAVRRLGREEDEPYARHLLTLAALAILLTAPLGATLLSVLGPRLLPRSRPPARLSEAKDTGSNNSGFEDESPPLAADITEDGEATRAGFGTINNGGVPEVVQNGRVDGILESSISSSFIDKSQSVKLGLNATPECECEGNDDCRCGFGLRKPSLSTIKEDAPAGEQAGSTRL